eukprot:CAMPEP_0197551096 /NCGR_PEP_ID=MMETSP1320-20131121/4470_1 /TAXON_ID=91990 /ORGANISM="Bolidomonas sp., Strain RCC2347" /LENGTH=120 /DNA_ID=CAMNT_0043111543 /DNA_START=267 /DNA_END=625 /DNA_ORIENTATION=+
MDAFLSGLLSASGAAFAKVAFDGDSSLTVLLSARCPQDTALGLATFYTLRGVCYLVCLGLNGLGLAKHCKSMKERGSAAGLALSTCWNFIITAFYGYVVFKEQKVFTPLWCFGFCLILLG